MNNDADMDLIRKFLLAGVCHLEDLQASVSLLCHAHEDTGETVVNVVAILPTSEAQKLIEVVSEHLSKTRQHHCMVIHNETQH